MTVPGPVRTVEVPAERVTGWVERFLDAHGAAAVIPTADGMELTAEDGSWASMSLWWTPERSPVEAGSGAWRAAAGLAGVARSAPPMLAVAVRRGGWAVGVVADGRERAGKAGRAYVQSHTAAGGSSQKRYARRRANQAAGLVGDAAERLAIVVSDPGLMAGVSHVVTAGDRLLVRQVLADAGVALTEVGPLPVADPRRLTLGDLAERVRGVLVRVRNS